MANDGNNDPWTASAIPQAQLNQQAAETDAAIMAMQAQGGGQQAQQQEAMRNYLAQMQAQQAQGQQWMQMPQQGQQPQPQAMPQMGGGGGWGGNNYANSEAGQYFRMEMEQLKQREAQMQAYRDWYSNGGGPGGEVGMGFNPGPTGFSGFSGQQQGPNQGPNPGTPGQAQGPSQGVPSSGQIGPVSGWGGINSGQIGPTQGAFADPGITGTQSFSPNGQFGWGLNSFAPSQTNMFGLTPAEMAAAMNANNMMSPSPGFDSGGNGNSGIGGPGGLGGGGGGGYGFGIGPGPGGENSVGPDGGASPY